jgi:hypothetical protein
MRILGRVLCAGTGVDIQTREMRKNAMDINVGDVLKLKKQHPCGSREWEVLRVGADFRLKCLGCGHQIMIARKLLEKNVKEIIEKA